MDTKRGCLPTHTKREETPKFTCTLEQCFLYTRLESHQTSERPQYFYSEQMHNPWTPASSLATEPLWVAWEEGGRKTLHCPTSLPKKNPCLYFLASLLPPLARSGKDPKASLWVAMRSPCPAWDQLHEIFTQVPCWVLCLLGTKYFVPCLPQLCQGGY